MDGTLNRCKIVSWVQQNQAKSHFIKHNILYKKMQQTKVYASNVIKL